MVWYNPFSWGKESAATAQTLGTGSVGPMDQTTPPPQQFSSTVGGRHRKTHKGRRGRKGSRRGRTGRKSIR